MGVPQNGWFIRETTVKMDDFWIPPFVETPKLEALKYGLRWRVATTWDRKLSDTPVFAKGCIAIR